MSYLDWKVGDRVACIRQVPDKGWGHALPRVNGVYTIRMISKGLGGKIVLKLAEIVNQPRVYPSPKYGDVRGEISFGASYFRKVQPRKTDISCFTAILNGHRIPEDA